MLEYLLFDVLIAYMLDLLFGDPYWLPHPIKFIGWLIIRTESFLRSLIKIDSEYPGKNIEKKERLAGIALTFFVVIITFIIVFIILNIARYLSLVLFHCINIYFIYSAIAAKCLANEANKVYFLLRNKDIVLARKQLSMLVRRETKNLSEIEIIDGVVETTAENTVDGVISPIFYAILGSVFGIGAPLACAFKAVSTLDSMVGYKNEKYINFGRFSAKTDDVFNFIPARISGVIIPLSAFICGMSFKRSFSTMIKYRRNHSSPNCGYPEAAVAGALGIRFGGTYTYFGKKTERLPIGDPIKEKDINDIRKAIALMYVSSIITVIAGGGLLLLFVMRFQ